MTALEVRSTAVSEILATIEDIADQTNRRICWPDRRHRGGTRRQARRRLRRGGGRGPQACKARSRIGT